MDTITSISMYVKYTQSSIMQYFDFPFFAILRKYYKLAKQI